MARKVKTKRPRAAAPAPKRYKDFWKAKFGHQTRSRALFMRQCRRYRASDRRDGFPLHIPLTLRQNENLLLSMMVLDEPPPHRTRGWRCDTPKCLHHGWGPMLRTVVWRQLGAKRFLCEPCMRRRLGRPIGPYHLRDCRMNEYHPSFVEHGLR